MAAGQLKVVLKSASYEWLPTASKYVTALVLKGIQLGKHDEISPHTATYLEKQIQGYE